MKKNYMIRIASGILLISLFINSCDFNFWGYNYDAEPLVKTTKICGIISDKYSGKPIQPAKINVNGQETWSDENGNYLLNYIIPDEIEPNQQEIGYLSIIALDYIPYSTTFIIYPVENKIDLQLEYSPPIIIDAVSHGDTTQAIIRDYQGVSDIKYVSAMFLEYRSGVWKRREFKMIKFANINLTDAYYQFVVVEDEILNIANIDDRIRITSIDKSDNMCTSYFSIEPDSSLFF